MRHLIYILWVLLLTSCGTTYQLSTINHDPIYASDGTEIQFDVVDNEFQLARKFRTDDTFRWNFAQYAMRQDLRWNYDFYWNNRMYRSPYASPFDFYWDSHNYWWNWASNSHFNMGFNHWDRFGFYGQGMGWSYSWNNRRWSSNQWGNPYGWNNYYGWNNGFYNRYRGTNVAYHTGRRSSTMSNRDRIGQASMIESTKRRTNRTIVNKTKSRRNFVIEENDNVDKEAIKLKRTNPNIRIIRNPNNVIIRNNNNKPVRNYNRPENNTRNSNNNIRNNNSRPPRTSTPPRSSSPRPVISRPTTRSSGNNSNSSTSRRKN